MEEGKDRPASWIVQNEWLGPSYTKLATLNLNDAYESCRYELLVSVFGWDIMVQVERLASQEHDTPNSNIFAERLARMIYQKKQSQCDNTVDCITGAAYELWSLEKQVSEEHHAAQGLDPTTTVWCIQRCSGLTGLLYSCYHLLWVTPCKGSWTIQTWTRRRGTK